MAVCIRDASRAEACLCSQLVIRQTVRDAVFFQGIHHAHDCYHEIAYKAINCSLFFADNAIKS